MTKLMVKVFGVLKVIEYRIKMLFLLNKIKSKLKMKRIFIIIYFVNLAITTLGQEIEISPKLGNVLYNSDGEEVTHVSGSVTVLKNNKKDYYYVKYFYYRGYVPKKSFTLEQQVEINKIIPSSLESIVNDVQLENNVNAINKLPPILSITDISFSKDLLNAEEIANLSVTLKNSGPGAAHGVYVNLECNLDDIIYPQKVLFPVIDAKNGEENVTIDIKGGFNLPTSEAILKIEVVEPNFKIRIQGKQLRIPTSEFKKPELLLAQYAVVENQSANPNNQIDINEMIDLKFAIQNIGQGTAENVTVEVENKQNGVMFLGVEKDNGMMRNNPEFIFIQPGKFEIVVYKYFVNSEFTDDEMEFKITTNERYGKFGFTENKLFPINKELEEAGHIRTIAVVDEEVKKEVVIEDIPDFVVDVDTYIPVINVVKSNTYALIIGNEDYRSKQRGLTSEQNVEFAANDALVFSQYCIKTLGIPSNQVRMLQDATAAEMNQAIAWLRNLSRVENGKAKLTDEAIQGRLSDPDFALKTGAGKYSNYQGINGNAKGPSGQYIDLMLEPDVVVTNLTNLENEWCSHYNVRYPNEVLENRIEYPCWDTTITSFIPVAPDDIKRIDERITTHLIANIPKCVLAKNDSEYEAEKNKIIEDIKNMELDKSIEYWSKVWADAKAKYDEYND